MISDSIFMGSQALEALVRLLNEKQYSKVAVLVDENTARDCLPIVRPFLPTHEVIQISSGEIHKNLDTCQAIWHQMTYFNMDRNAVLLNLGGGVIGDMGGFVAATYKRGIDFFHVPTTLLAQVDASFGGKLGVDFEGLKNHIGMFKNPQAVIVYPPFLKTLPFRQLRAGFAEVIKHHLIMDEEGWKTLSTWKDLRTIALGQVIRHSIGIKLRIVESDPIEKGIRKALNFGHTIGHAIESLFLEDTETTLLHGEAIALGMVCETYIAYKRALVGWEEFQEVLRFIRLHYPKVLLDTVSIHAVYSRMLQDKKNKATNVNCTLLRGIGSFCINQLIHKAEVEEALLYYQKYY